MTKEEYKLRADVLLWLWLRDNVLTDSEYHRIKKRLDRKYKETKDAEQSSTVQ
jgi:hypothetical protein